MKASNLKRLTAALFILLALIFGGQVVRFSQCLQHNDWYGWDARLRRNEIRCAHQGVNSFRIWNREMTLPGFTPFPRSDKPDVPRGVNDVYVHAYPPWHTAMCYWYGWMPERAYLITMTFFFWLCLCFVVCEIIRLAKAQVKDYWVVVGLSLALIIIEINECFNSLNYGVLILAAFLLMNKALEKNQNILAGIAWSVMMIKPQVGLLFVWPLFWRRRYITIVTAAAICLAETVITSGIVHEPVIDLILQVAQLGGGYSGGIVGKVLGPCLGKYAVIVMMGLFFILTGFATWTLRKNRDFIVCCMPVMLVIPVWTYSALYDRVILLPVFIILLGHIFDVSKSPNIGRLVRGFYCIIVAFFVTWILLRTFANVDPVEMKVLLKLVRVSLWAVSVVAFLVFLVRKEFSPK